MAAVLSVFNRQRKHPVPLAGLRRFGSQALAAVAVHAPGPQPPVLPGLEEVEVTFVSDATIARVHQEFMDIPGATDVITFLHGEILISTETAWENAPLYGRHFHHELALYIVHGLLHLNGYVDEAPQDATAMAAAQEALLARVLASAPLPMVTPR